MAATGSAALTPLLRRTDSWILKLNVGTRFLTWNWRGQWEQHVFVTIP